MSEQNIFEQATREKLRFETPKGLVDCEDLWQLPLQSKSLLDLDSIAKAVNKQLKEVSEESFVSAAAPRKAQTLLELRLSILKHIIGVKLADDAKAKQRAAKQVERERLLELRESKQLDQMKGLTIEEVDARLAALESD